MGFQRMAENEAILARFHSLHAYAIQGFTVDATTVKLVSGTAHGVAYRMAIGFSLNQLCHALLKDDFVDDEEAWSKEHNCTPPYAVIHIGPTEQFSCVGGFRKTEASQTFTYDGFGQARDELRVMQDRVLPPIMTALSCAALPEGRNARFRPLERAVFGITPTGDTIYDLRVEMRGIGYTSVHVTGDCLDSFMDRAVDLVAEISPKVSRLFQLGLLDDDPLKRFLYFYLAIEIETHRVYSTIDHVAVVERLLAVPDRVRTAVSGLLAAHPAGLTNLLDRFTWCSLCAWTHLTDADVNEFKRLKQVRDRIAHGAIEAPPAESVVTAERLARKLLALASSCGA